MSGLGLCDGRQHRDRALFFDHLVANAAPSGSFSLNHSSASSGVANTLRWSTSPTSLVRVDCATRISSAEQSPHGMIAVTQTLTTFAGQQWRGTGARDIIGEML